MNTYGMHSIHGRAPAIATGLTLARPELSVWVITGDGDALSIGGNHSHPRPCGATWTCCILMFNNRIYGLTKGQVSPTSEQGKVTKTTPLGSLDRPFEPAALALGAGATFVARVLDTEGQLLGNILRRAAAHRGTAYIEILQNCPVFNDGSHDELSDKATKADRLLVLEAGKPMLFGKRRTEACASARTSSPRSSRWAPAPARCPSRPAWSTTRATKRSPTPSPGSAGRTCPPQSGSSARCVSRR